LRVGLHVLETLEFGFGVAFLAALCGIGVIALFSLVWLAEEDLAGRRPLYPEWPEDEKVVPVRKVELRIAA
jgi:hypothetical protein